MQGGIVQDEMRSLCAHGSRCPLWRRTQPSMCSRRRQYVYTACHRAERLFKSRRALIAFTVLDALLWRQAAAAAVLSPSTLDVYTALANVQGACSSRDALLLRSRCSMPFFGVRPPPLLCSRRPHRTFVPRSRHHARRSFKSRRARCALMVLDALFGVGPPPPLRSCRPHRTFVPLLPLSKA